MSMQPAELGDVREELERLIRARQPASVADLLLRLPSRDTAEALERLPAEGLAATVSLLGDERAADVLEHLEASDAARLLVRLSRTDAADVLEEMDPDDAADIVEELSDTHAQEILVEMEAADADEVRSLMAYPPHSAAGLMTREMVVVSPDLTVEATLAAVRRAATEAETIYYVYVAEPNGQLVGVLNLRDLVLAKPGVHIRELTRLNPVAVQADDDQEAAARLLADHSLLAIPVVDRDGRLLGIVTADDASDVLEREATEDTLKLGGSVPLDKPYLRTSPIELVWKRVRWLLVLFVAEAYTGTVLRAFSDELSEVVALAFFVPLLIGTGGNTGTQITTTITRALATGDVRFRDAFRVFRKELCVAIMLGLVMAGATFIRSWTLQVGYGVGFVVAITAACIVIWSSAVASLLPIFLRRFRLDPAVVSGPFITTIVDGTGLVIYFELARLLLHLR
jgi:magnesium transporter